MYPCPLVSVRFRESIFKETGHTIMNLLAVSSTFTPHIISSSSAETQTTQSCYNIHICIHMFSFWQHIILLLSHPGNSFGDAAVLVSEKQLQGYVLVWMRENGGSWNRSHVCDRVVMYSSPDLLHSSHKTFTWKYKAAPASTISCDCSMNNEF